ncbi:imidazole glycerol phosphate synthase subunit HisF [Candidatus Kaiserbacteria bacterium CG10_big_fil_rev_8_21_14_0_10_59_10]|uniref:imidazole glycerol-phosphate synthase n=1 Tax=Candidatus Kaiserbacteria bacterium CG10_big_fil_rev_8_21_14_0_10_59_10 TaxID=1974612 RepID=A0A2H0U7X8_9BACT|nr:MAG: imidazole glycerol phosphate synthase subunit HisF [Candidatus Kaiserbacteria bacterium CG10_big_fil_rev_8_21_14_0_10_59_10]
MLKVRVIPCLTIKDHKLVKSVRFRDHRNIGNYVAAVRVFNARDVDELIFLDLDAGKRGIERWIVEAVTKECFMPVTLGGGVKTVEDVQLLLSAGADKVAMNSAVLECPRLIAEASRRYGSQCVVVSIDVRMVHAGWRVFTHGGSADGGKDAVSWAKEVEDLGAGEILLNSIDLDGTMEGYDTELIRAVADAVRIPVIALGGAGIPGDCVKAVQAGASAVAAASMFQYTQVTPNVIKRALADVGFPARIG